MSLKITDHIHFGVVRKRRLQRGRELAQMWTNADKGEGVRLHVEKWGVSQMQTKANKGRGLKITDASNPVSVIRATSGHLRAPIINGGGDSR